MSGGAEQLNRLCQDSSPAADPLVPFHAKTAEAWWQDRKRWFFKPATGFGSRGVYRGDKLTRRVFGEVMRGGYVAQEFAAPSERHLRSGSEHPTLKVDLRHYVYDGQVLLRAARLYQGQTANFRTAGGGFAPLIELMDDQGTHGRPGNSGTAGTWRVRSEQERFLKV